MALGDVRLCWQDVWRVVRRELPVAAALGLVVAGMETVLARFSKGIGLDVLLVVGLSMLVCTVLGGIIGVLLPFAARRMGTDPATLSSPLITSVMDPVGVFIYFAFAYAFPGRPAAAGRIRAPHGNVRGRAGTPPAMSCRGPGAAAHCPQGPCIASGHGVADCHAAALRREHLPQRPPGLVQPHRCRPGREKAPSVRGFLRRITRRP